ncbi:MAG: mechanosensitive ion channel family protein [Ignavibacteriales bacterium]|nr:mechanosensitive ion channel family protein [Ignavibacteriales bacterium]
MFQEFLEQTFLYNRVLDYLLFLSTFIFSIIVIKIFKHIVLRKIKKWTQKTANTFDDLLIHNIEKRLLPLLYFVALYLSIQFLTIHPTAIEVIDILFLILLTIFVVRLIISIINYLVEIYLVKKEEQQKNIQSIKALLPVAKILVWGFAIFILLDNLGVKITPLLAGLGVGGIAIALAAQSIFGDLFAYFIMLFDRPFEVGDFIITGEHIGSVEHIGIKSSRIRSISGEQIVISNTDLVNARVRNYKRMERRRVVFKLGVTYQATLEQLKEIPKTIKEIVESTKDTDFDRAHFFSYGDFSLIFEIVFYINSSDYTKYMDIQQEINFKIKEEFEKRGIEFAYPTQTLFLEK